MVVQHNITAMNANRYFGINNSKLSKSLEKLSSGFAINRAGDNAAGLAVSEKMRSQIAGMTQGVKNAQDGISMVQTFEGALTETDSILQRMKTLADQAAHGTYQDEVDREAIQLEFNQLNDELNQIADTDFNGVVMLNGGQMADGLKAVDGSFDYANKTEQLMAQAREMLKNDINAANKTIADVLKEMGSKNFDLSANGNAPEWNTVDNNKYTKEVADELWKSFGIVDGSGNAKTDVVNELTVTFKKNSSGGWDIEKAVGNDGAEYTSTTLTATKVDGNKAADGSSSTANGWGGFTLNVTSSTNFTSDEVNVLFDDTTSKAGDTVTLKFTNGTNTQLAPKNIGLASDSSIVTDEGDGTEKLGALAAALEGTLTDADMTDALAKKFDALNGQQIVVKYDGTADVAISIGDTDLTGITGDGTNGNFTINGESFYVDMSAATTLDIYDKSGGTKLASITLTEAKANGAADKKGTNGVVKGIIAVEKPQYVDSSASIRVDAGENPELGSSSSYQRQLKEARENLAKLALIDVSTYDMARDFLTSNGVSVSDAFDNSTAKLTYTDHLIMQVGARSKDAVDFTFSYASEGLGELKANMDCSARADGLGTADLSLLTANSANAAIDKIDNAINKVSMVRATFGATQNRLEHKIDNMNVTIENLTSAESRIRDTNMAEEMMNFTKQQILSQASQSMLAQANQLPQSVLQLLQ